MTARFVRTQKEMEGRYEDVWALVDETDDVESWPPDAELSLVGQPAPRHDGARAGSRAACATRSTFGSPGCSTPPCSARRSRTDGCARSTSTQRWRSRVCGP